MLHFILTSNIIILECRKQHIYVHSLFILSSNPVNLQSLLQNKCLVPHFVTVLVKKL